MPLPRLGGNVCFPPIADIHARSGRYNEMKLDQFVASQRRAVILICVVIIAMAMLMWVATSADSALGVGWSLDRQILWLAPPITLFALLLRFCAMAIFKWVGRNA